MRSLQNQLSPSDEGCHQFGYARRIVCIDHDRNFEVTKLFDVAILISWVIIWGLVLVIYFHILNGIFLTYFDTSFT